MKTTNRNHAFSYRNQPYLGDDESRVNNIVNFIKIRRKSEVKYFGNEIFICIAIVTILIISIGGNSLIKNRTKQQLIYI